MALTGVLLVLEFIHEYPWIAFFAGIWLALTLAGIIYSIIKARRDGERAEAEEAARNRKYQKSRYTPEDRAALEAHILD